MVASGVPSSCAAPAAWVATASNCWSRMLSSRRSACMCACQRSASDIFTTKKVMKAADRAKFSHMPNRCRLISIASC